MVKFKVEDANFDKIYPVGSIYMSINNTDPSELFGGEWERIKDTFLLASGDTYDGGSTGGSATHTLTTNEMPTHSHTQNAHSHKPNNSDNTVKMLTANKNVFLSTKREYTPQTSGTGLYYVEADANTTISEYDNTANTTATNQNTGGGQSHNNMPPYLAVYCWVRIA